MVSNDEKAKTLTAELMEKRMEELGMSARDLSVKVGVVYEHIRNILRGNIVPSKLLVKEIAKALKVPLPELERVAVADRIQLKFGDIPFELSGKNPELEPIERAWPKLSKEHKADILAMVQTFVKRDLANSRG